MRRSRGFGIQRAGGVGLELALVPLFANGEVKCAGHDQDSSDCIWMPMRHDLHARQKFNSVDVQTGLRRVPEQGYVLWGSGKSFVNDVLRKPDDARVNVLSVSRGPDSDHAKAQIESGCVPVHGVSCCLITNGLRCQSCKPSVHAVSAFFRLARKASFLWPALVFLMNGRHARDARPGKTGLVAVVDNHATICLN